MRTDDLFYWIKERYATFLKKEAGKPKPWTEDVILSSYRFCNVHREKDKVTRWITENWRTPHAYDPYLWFALVMARLINQPASLEQIGFPGNGIWSAVDFAETCHEIAAKGRLFNGAYIVSTNGHAMNKVDYLAQYVLQPLWDDRKGITADLRGVEELAVAHRVLTKYNGLGSFMAAQVIADLKYVEPLSECVDWWTWAASGPGSRRGLNRVTNRPVNASCTEKEWLNQLQALHAAVQPLVKKAKIPALHAQDLQNCLCEFDKFERVRLGEGRPKSTYPGRA